jgi:hypothetical protein
MTGRPHDAKRGPAAEPDLAPERTGLAAKVDVIPLGVAIPWASVPDEAMVADEDTRTKTAALRLPDELEARLAALEKAIVCPWACGAACPWRGACEVTR